MAEPKQTTAYDILASRMSNRELHQNPITEAALYTIQSQPGDFNYESGKKQLLSYLSRKAKEKVEEMFFEISNGLEQHPESLKNHPITAYQELTKYFADREAQK